MTSLVLRSLCFLALFGCGSGSALANSDDEPRPNFIVILCDNLGYGDIEPFGSTLHRTPALNRMAAEGRKFTDFYVSAGVCTPSRASLMTGCYAQRIGMHLNPRDGWVLRPLSPFGLHPDEVTIAEVLQPRGYATLLVGKWHLGDQSDFWPTNQGFDDFFGIPYSDDMTQAVGRRIAPRFDGAQWPPLPLMEQGAVVEAPVDRNGLTKRYTDRAIKFIRENRDHPFFLLLSHAMPGSTKLPFSSPEFRGRSGNGSWGDAVEELDWSTGQILDALDRLKLSENTLVVWTSDNGAPVNREDLRRGSNLPLYGRGYSTAEGAFRVPTIIRWTDHVGAGSVCGEVMTTMDLLPTFAALAGASLDDSREIDGRSAVSLLTGDGSARTPHEAFFYYETDQLQAVRSGPFKLFLPLQEFDRHPHFRSGEGGDPLLFDVVADIGCQRNLAAERPDIVAKLTALADAHRIVLGDRGVAGAGCRPRGEVANPTAVTFESTAGR